MQKEELENMMKEPLPKQQVSVVSLCMVKEEKTLYGMNCFTGARQAAETVKPLLELADREIMVVMSLDAKKQPIAVEVVAVGGLSMCQVDVKNIFKHAILSNADCVICFHNHPTGDPSPSKEDYEITKRIGEAGKILGLTLLDHIIIGRDGFYSFREHRDLVDSLYREDGYH